MTSIELESWLKQKLSECFANSELTLSFIIEKKQMVNNRIYKYYPISDNNTQPQYAIENLKNSVIYMSRISNFNDPFDSFMSFSLDDLIADVFPNIVRKTVSLPESKETDKALSYLFRGLLVGKELTASEKYLLDNIMSILKKYPELLKGGEEQSRMLEKTLPLFGMQVMTDISTKKINMSLLQELNEDIDSPSFILEIVKRILDNPSILSSSTKLNEEDIEKVKILFGKASTQDTTGLSLLKQNSINKLAEINRQFEPEIINAVETTRRLIDDTFCISCFSTTNNNALMWAHYTNKHKGFCVEYDLAKCSDLLVFLFPVIYSKERAHIPNSLFDFSDIKNIKVKTDTQTNIDLILALLRKSDAWQYENEWRLILSSDVEGLSSNFYSIDNISKVILGCRTEKIYEEQIREICIEKNIKMSKMELDKREYKLVEHEII